MTSEPITPAPAGHVLFDVDDDVCTITINRPKVRNAVDGPTAQALRAAFERFEADDDLRVAVLTEPHPHRIGDQRRGLAE